MPILGITDRRRLPRLGKIRTGIKAVNSRGVEYPKAVDYLVCPPEVQEVFGERPTEIEVMLPTESEMEVAPDGRKRVVHVPHLQPYIPRRQMVELLEDGQDDIVEPKRAEILDIVRTLRVTSSSTGDTQIRSDGTTNITFNADTQIRGSKASEAQIPEYALIELPVIEGHNNDRGNPVRTEFRVSIRVDVDQERRTVFRLTIPDMDERLRVIYQDIADQAQKLIGDDLGIEILRAG